MNRETEEIKSNQKSKLNIKMGTWNVSGINEKEN